MSEEHVLKFIARPYNQGHHRFAVTLASWTFLLLIAGALVTSNDAGLSVPDWPTSFGSWYKIPKLVGGVRFEHIHRMIAQVAGLLTLILAIWTWRVEKRRWLRILALAAVGGKNARVGWRRLQGWRIGSVFRFAGLELTECFSKLTRSL